jgi:hypothetical protein
MRLALAVVAALGTVGPSLSGESQPSVSSIGTLPDVTVKIVISSEAGHTEACKQGKYSPVDILVITGQPQPWSCVDTVFFRHDENHPLHCKTIVVLGTVSQNQVIWESSAPFTVQGIALEEGNGPANPFQSYKVPSGVAIQHKSGPIVGDAVDSRYKVSFLIGGLKVDPDIQCRKI